MRVLLLAAALRHASRTAHGLSIAAQHKRRVLRGVLQQELEGQHRARVNLEAQLERRRDVDDDDGEEYAKEYAKAVKRAAADTADFMASYVLTPSPPADPTAMAAAAVSPARASMPRLATTVTVP